jgi:tRNA A-37 threonylcarbamoyl transferase component Bud32
MKTMVTTAGSGQPGALDIPDVLVPGAKAGPWVIERELGRGGMGAVYAVVHDEIGKRAALKVVHKRLLVPGFNCDRMLLEAKVVNQVGHPGIVDIFETGKLADGRPYIVMERLDGHTLSERADASKLLPDLVIAILLQVCDALVAAHAAGVVHRDLKLDNVFLIENADEPLVPRVKLLDWGIAKLIHHDAKHTIDGQLVGTPQYLAPEQARGLAVSPQTDVYSLGVMAYELFLEQLPFEAETAAEVMAMHLRQLPPPPHELWPDIPEALEDLLLAMLDKQPEHRPAVAEVAHRLLAVRDELERRRHAYAQLGPRAAIATPMDPSRPNRVVSSVGLAATELAWSHRAKRWQYAIGVSALAISGMLFWISRGVDRSANAATTAAAMAERGAATADQPGDEPSAVDRGASQDPARRRPSIDRSLARVSPVSDAASDGATAALAVRTVPVAGRGRSTGAGAAIAETAVRASLPGREARPGSVAPTAPGSRTLLRPAASRSVPVRQSPVAPRRGIKLDPDGTLDPYL